MREKGFTLIELLVVVGIIGTLSAALLPVLQKARDTGMTATCTNNLHQLYLAFQMYAEDYSGWYPFADGYEEQNDLTVFDEGPAANGYWSAVPVQLQRLGYCKDKSCFWCPTLRKAYPERETYLRYAMNYAAADMHPEKEKSYTFHSSPADYWLACCLYVEVTWDPSRYVERPHQGGQAEVVLLNDGSVKARSGQWFEDWFSPRVKD